MYRRLLRMSQNLPSKDKENIIKQIKVEFRKSSDISDPNHIKQLLEKANSTLGYIKMITPRTVSNQTGTFRKVYANDSTDNLQTKSAKKAMSNWHGTNIDPDSSARHYKSLKRAGFINNDHAKGIF